MTTDTLAKLAAEFSRYFASANSVDVGERVSVPTAEWRALFAALTAQALPAAEPFGYFKAQPFGWTDCAETDEGAVALYEWPQQAAQAVRLEAAERDAARLDWLETQRAAYGLQDIHEGNRWEIFGAYATAREAIDCAGVRNIINGLTVGITPGDGAAK